MACEDGHIDEFPWHFWVGHRAGCSQSKFLTLRSERPGLSGLILSCPDCKAEKSMEGIFGFPWKEKNIDCSGNRPWLAGDKQNCEKPPRVLQRGASNIYFPVIAAFTVDSIRDFFPCL